ncbi:MAG: branched-chain amino acid aminotransferase [Desulfomonile tiedjei]|uniref:Branched-chain-amino-acid aminotransferase n=1 Tax=Desulfomonile tiedjei TaxID=2358 RepID=A0A9D6UZ38_9BACT|nr:branched-chain amino acid aminotransferase [Desulfomonile tiedjei]
MGTLPRNRAASPQYDENKLGFGTIFTEHMLQMRYSADEGGWQVPEIVSFQDLVLHPATMMLHYGQQVFEGLKAFAGPDEEDILLFRPDMNIARFNKSCARLCIPIVDSDLFMDQMSKLIRLDRDWIPRTHGTSLYVRPTIIATDPFLGVRPSKQYLFYIILCPVGAYYPEGFNPVKIVVTDKYIRACRGGLGEAKTAANYAASLLAAEEAHEEGFTQVLWLNAVDKCSIEEVGTMNIFFRIDGEVVTPALEGTILPGVTRDSVIRFARDLGNKVTERQISIEEVVRAAETGSLQEIFGSGTAAVISPVSHFRYKGRDYMVGDGQTGPVARRLFDDLTAIQTGHKPDPYGWMVNVGK